MTREQAKERLNGMSFQECIDMWNDTARTRFDFFRIIEGISDDTYWNIFARKLGGFNFMWYLLDSSMDTFDRRDEFVFYDDNTCTFYSFDDKAGLMKYTEEWFIEELINREN